MKEYKIVMKDIKLLLKNITNIPCEHKHLFI